MRSISHLAATLALHAAAAAPVPVASQSPAERRVKPQAQDKVPASMDSSWVSSSPNGRPAGANKAFQRAAMKKRRVKANKARGR